MADAVGPQELRAVVDLRFPDVVVFRIPLWSGHFRLISRTRVEEAMMFHVTPTTWPKKESQAKLVSEKKERLGRACHQGVILTS